MSRDELYLTSLERKMKEILKELGVDYIEQYSTRTGFVIDFAVNTDKGNFALEVDGEVWHSSKKATKRDRFKDYMLKREGWQVVRIKEKELNELEIDDLTERLKKELKLVV